MQLPFQKAKLVSDQQFYLAHEKSKTLSILCSPPAFSWIKVVGCLCNPLPHSLPLPCFRPRHAEASAASRMELKPSKRCLRRRRRERLALHGRSRPDGVSLGLPCSRRSSAAGPNRRLGGCREGPPRTRLDPRCLASVQRTASPILSGRNRFAVIGA